jgi:hypothetical protein
MRYLTRDLYNQNQDDIGIPETGYERALRLRAAALEYQKANDRYLRYIAGIRDSVPVNVAAFIDTGLHDATIVSILETPESLSIALNTGHAPFFGKKRPRLLIVFGGVCYTAGLRIAVGQIVLHHEVLVAADCFELNALLDKDELTVRFRDVALS